MAESWEIAPDGSQSYQYDFAWVEENANVSNVPKVFPGGEDNMISLDAPRHAEQRKLVSRRFTPSAVRALEPYLLAVIDELHLAPEMKARVLGGTAKMLLKI